MRLCVFLLCLCAPLAARAACGTAPVASLALRIVGDRLLVPVTIDGSAETFILDTGAGITVLAKEAADRLYIPHDFDHAAQVGGVGGANSVLFIGQPRELTLGRVRLSHPALPIVDLPAREADGTQTAGFLGADVLRQYDLDVDAAQGRLDLWAASGPGCSDDSPPWPESTSPIAIDIDEGNHIRAPFRVGGLTLTGVLDTGAAGFVMTTRAAMRAGVTQETLDADPRIRGTGVNSRAWSGYFHLFRHVQFGAVEYPLVPTALVPNTGAMRNDALIGADALIGMPLLRRQRIWISYRAHEMRALPAN